MFQCAYNILIWSTQLMSNTIANIFVFLFLGINMTHKLISFTITIHSIVTRQHHSPCGGAGSMDNRRTIPFRNTQHHQTSNYHRVIQHHHPDEVNTTTRKLRGERVEHDTQSLTPTRATRTHSHRQHQDYSVPSQPMGQDSRGKSQFLTCIIQSTRALNVANWL